MMCVDKGVYINLTDSLYEFDDCVGVKRNIQEFHNISQSKISTGEYFEMNNDRCHTVFRRFCDG